MLSFLILPQAGGKEPSPAAAFSTKCSSCQKVARSGYFSFTVKAMKCSSVIFRSVDFVSSSCKAVVATES